MERKTIHRFGRERIHQGYCFDVVVDEVRWPNRKRLKRDLIIHPGVSVMVPLLDPNRMILVRQYRYGAGGLLWELPAGTLDGKESPLQCAKREIEEETGYRAQTWSKIASCFASPGFNTELIHCFVAGGLKRTGACPEEDEVLELKICTLPEVQAMVKARKIQDAKSLVALFYFFTDGQRIGKEIS